MITSINRIAQELRAVADAHLQVHSFHYGDIVQTYNSIGAIEHCTLLCDVKNATIQDGYTTCTIELMVLDRVLTFDNEVKNAPQREVESDTLQIINDLYFIISSSPRWQAFGMVEQGAVARKVIENTPDKVSGWFISLNLRIRNQQGICDIPVFDYDYGTVVAPANCPGVTIIKNGQFFTVVEAGGTFSYETTEGCPTLCDLISEVEWEAIKDCMDLEQIEDATEDLRLKCETILFVDGADDVRANGDYFPDGDPSSLDTVWTNEIGYSIEWNATDELWYLSNNAPVKIYQGAGSINNIAWVLITDPTQIAAYSVITGQSVIVNDQIVSEFDCTACNPYNLLVANTNGDPIGFWDGPSRQYTIPDIDIQLFTDGDLQFSGSVPVLGTATIDIDLT